MLFIHYHHHSPSWGPIARIDLVTKVEHGVRRSRGFGFIDFVHPQAAESLVRAGHVKLDGRVVEIKKNTIAKKSDKSEIIG